jgi:hypothetical protein
MSGSAAAVGVVPRKVQLPKKTNSARKIFRFIFLHLQFFME